MTTGSGLLVNQRYSDVTIATLLRYANATSFIDLPKLPPIACWFKQ
jgi:hypothetical protein